MDPSIMTDINELKAMAYDQIAIKEQAERNLATINTRIGELAQQSQLPPVPVESQRPTPAPTSRKRK